MVILHRMTYHIIHNDTYDVIRTWKSCGANISLQLNNTLCVLNNYYYILCTLQRLHIIKQHVATSLNNSCLTTPQISNLQFLPNYWPLYQVSHYKLKISNKRTIPQFFFQSGLFLNQTVLSQIIIRNSSCHSHYSCRFLNSWISDKIQQNITQSRTQFYCTPFIQRNCLVWIQYKVTFKRTLVNIGVSFIRNREFKYCFTAY
jgi:hypothetical protein